MVERSRLISPPDDFLRAFPKLNFTNSFALVTEGEAVLVTDPTLLADVYNSRSRLASAVRSRGAFLMSFSGDFSAPIWWCRPYLVIPTRYRRSRTPRPIPRRATVVGQVFTDSGSVVFLPLPPDLPSGIGRAVASVLAQHNGARLRFPPARWTLWYEQFKSPRPNWDHLYRDIVVRLDLVDSTHGTGRSAGAARG